LIRLATGAALKFLYSIPGKNRMRMRIHETRRNQPAGCIDFVTQLSGGGFDLLPRAGQRDFPVADQHRGIMQNA
jgi:hypothetical protein